MYIDKLSFINIPDNSLIIRFQQLSDLLVIPLRLICNGKTYKVKFENNVIKELSLVDQKTNHFALRIFAGLLTVCFCPIVMVGLMIKLVLSAHPTISAIWQTKYKSQIAEKGDHFDEDIDWKESIRRKIKSLQKNAEMVLPDPSLFDKAPLSKMFLKNQFNYGDNEAFIDSIIEELLHFERTNPLEFDIYLKEKIKNLKELVELDLQKNIQQELSFFLNWEKYLKVEVVQGIEDEQEVLGMGVCLAMCTRLQVLGQSHPTISAEEFAEQVKILPIDRFRQAKYNLGTRLSSTKDSFFRFLRKSGLNSQIEEFACDRYSFEDFFKNPQFPAKICHGWIRVDLVDDYHAVLACLDRSKNRIWFFDPNVGFFCFEKENQSFDASTKQFFIFFQELLDLRYPSTVENITINRFLPL